MEIICHSRRSDIHTSACLEVSGQVYVAQVAKQTGSSSCRDIRLVKERAAERLQKLQSCVLRFNV